MRPGQNQFPKSYHMKSLEIIKQFLSSDPKQSFLNFSLELTEKYISNPNWQFKHAGMLVLSQIFDFLGEKQNKKKWLESIKAFSKSENVALLQSSGYALENWLSAVSESVLAEIDGIWNLILVFLEHSLPVVRIRGLAVLNQYIAKASVETRLTMFPFLQIKLGKCVFNDGDNDGEVASTLLCLNTLLANCPLLIENNIEKLIDLVNQLVKLFGEKECPFTKLEILDFLSVLKNCSKEKLFFQFGEPIKLNFVKIFTSFSEKEIGMIFPKGFELLLKFNKSKINNFETFFDKIVNCSVKIIQIIFSKQNQHKASKYKLTYFSNLFSFYSQAPITIFEKNLESIFYVYFGVFEYYLRKKSKNLHKLISPIWSFLKVMKQNDYNPKKMKILTNQEYGEQLKTVSISEANLIMKLIRIVDDAIFSQSVWCGHKGCFPMLYKIFQIGGRALKPEHFEFLFERCLAIFERNQYLHQKQNKLQSNPFVILKNRQISFPHRFEYEKFGSKIAECVGSILSHHKTEHIISQIISKFDLLEDAQELQILKIKLFLICDILERAPDLISAGILRRFTEIHKAHICNESIDLANAAVFGSSLAVLRLDDSIILSVIRGFWEVLSKHSILRSLLQNSDEVFFRDNVIAALGKFLSKMQRMARSNQAKNPFQMTLQSNPRSNELSLEVNQKFAFWVSFLPIKRDFAEFVCSIDIFCELVQESQIHSFSDPTILHIIDFCLTIRNKLGFLQKNGYIGTQAVERYTSLVDSIVRNLMNHEKIKAIIGNYHWNPEDLDYLISVKKTIEAGDCFSSLIKQL